MANLASPLGASSRHFKPVNYRAAATKFRIVSRYCFVSSQSRRSHEPPHRRAQRDANFSCCEVSCPGAMHRFADRYSSRRWRSPRCEHATREPPALSQHQRTACGSRRQNEPAARLRRRKTRAVIQAPRAKLRQGKGRTMASSMDRRTRAFSMPATGSPPATITSTEVMGTTRFAALVRNV